MHTNRTSKGQQHQENSSTLASTLTFYVGVDGVLLLSYPSLDGTNVNAKKNCSVASTAVCFGIVALTVYPSLDRYYQ